MERLPPKEEHTMAAMSLYLNDIEDVARLFATAGLTPKYSDDKYTFESLQELIDKRGTKPKKLSISSEGPSLDLRSSPLVGVYLSGGWTEKHRLLRRQIWELLAPRQYKLALLHPGWLQGLGSALLVVGWVIDEGPAPDALPIGLAVAAIASWTLGITAMVVRAGAGTRINLTHRHQATTFWSRNWEKIVIGAMGGLVVLAIQWVWNRVTSSGSSPTGPP